MKEFLDYLVKTWGASTWRLCNNVISIYFKGLYNNDADAIVGYYLRAYYEYKNNATLKTDIIKFESISLEEFLNKYRGVEFYTLKNFDKRIRTPDLLEWHILKSIN